MQLLNKNECQKSFVSKAFKGIVINDNLPQAQHQMYMACTPPPFQLGGGGGKNFRKVFAGGLEILKHSILSVWNTLVFLADFL